MDPTACYNEIQDIIADWDSATRGSSEERDAAEALLTAFDDLDQWLRKGGFLPRQWADARPEVRQ